MSIKIIRLLKKEKSFLTKKVCPKLIEIVSYPFLIPNNSF